MHHSLAVIALGAGGDNYLVKIISLHRDAVYLKAGVQNFFASMRGVTPAWTAVLRRGARDVLLWLSEIRFWYEAQG